MTKLTAIEKLSRNETSNSWFKLFTKWALGVAITSTFGFICWALTFFVNNYQFVKDKEANKIFQADIAHIKGVQADEVNERVKMKDSIISLRIHQMSMSREMREGFDAISKMLNSNIKISQKIKSNTENNGNYFTGATR
jgi:hypothetical protein